MNVLFLSTMVWDETGGTYAPTRLALEFSKRGHRVLFLEHRRSDTRATRGLPISIASLDEFGVPPLAIALAGCGVPLGSLDEMMPRVAKWLDETETPNEPRLVVLNSPFAPFAQLLPLLQTRGAWIVYYAQDDYAAMLELGMHQFNPRLEEYLVARADLNLALAAPVAEKWKARGHACAVLPDGVDPTEFQNATARAPNVLRGTECTLGVWGSLIAPMVDTALLRVIAETKPAWAINLIGPHESLPGSPSVYEPLRTLPNIRFHGPVQHADLKNYACAFDVCLIPAPDNGMSHGRDPIKLYEYLASHKPVVATHMPQLQGIPYVRVAPNAQECIAAIEHARREPLDPRVIDAFLAQHTWSHRAQAFLEMTRQMLQQPRACFGLFDAQRIEQLARTQPTGTLARHEWQEILHLVNQYPKLERELSAVQDWARELERAQRARQASLPMRVKKMFARK